MRSIRDSRLPEPYRSWIDRAQALPSNVRLMPRIVSVAFDLMIFILIGGMFSGMAVLIMTIFWKPLSDAPKGPFLILVGVSLLLLLVPVFAARRLYITLDARRDLRKGQLRQGILIGPQGILLRMEPNQCYVVPMNRFKSAKTVVHGADPLSETEARRFLLIETLDGPIEYFIERLNGSPEELNQYVAGMKK
jgi:membrane protein implicated in regulation of membrane protease activity